MSWLQDLPSELLANIALFADWHCLYVLRLARGCPRLTSLDYSLDPVDSDDEPGSRLTDSGLSVADQSHIGDLFDLLESRCREANIPPRFQIKLLV